MREFKPQGLSNTAWAFAAVSLSDERLFAILTRAAEWRVSEFNPQNLANMAWAFATVGWPDAKLFVVLAGAAE